ncbi:uncharacterized protein LOC106712680 [Papilio machaon]|uniref:uncharacterized protein LOC106712680 n=1 Tax=Papilio machaon TaxID=76193 RepID=UPI001E6632E7|nr:uncharacterized protein LOC106712680 [Papilio machaon]
MATEEEPDSLKIYWDHFFKAETGTYEKSTWLELFLAEFLVRLQEGVDPNQLIKFCPVSRVVTLVGCELLCGIHRVTSAANLHHAAPPPPSAPLPALHSGNGIANGHDGDVGGACGARAPASVFSRAQAQAQSSGAVLRAYVLRGPAWRCLVLLRTLGVEGLSCCRQLSSVLVWLWGELAGGAASPGAKPPPASHTPPIHMLFSHRIWTKQKLNQVPKTSSIASSVRSSASGRTKHNGVSKLDSNDAKSNRRSLAETEQSTESADSNDDLHILNKSMAIKVSAPSDQFEYFESPKRSSNDYPNEMLYTDPFYTPRKSKPKADDYINDKHKEIINTEISSFDFMLLITELLQELCKAESSLSGAEGSQISMQCINFSLKNLCSLQFGSLPAQANYNGEEMSRIKLALTELLIVSLDKVLIHSGLCAKLINSGILPMLLRILEDVICKTNAKYNTKEDRPSQPKDVEKSNQNEAENLLKYVFGIAYSITAFFHCLLMQCRTVDKLREFTDQFKLYGECLKGGLLKECIELMIRIPHEEEETSVILIKKLIESIGKLVSGMKRVRSEVIHSAACGRSWHKACRPRVAAGMHHHHDVLGEAGPGLPLPSACCVSVLYGTLTALVTDDRVSAQPELRTKILRVMLKCGVCCCFSPGFLMECIVRLMLTHNSVAPRCLQLLEHTVYGDLGSSILIPRVTDQLPCSICEPCDDNKDLGRKYCHHGVSPIERKSVWSFLIHYNSLLQLDNHNNVLHAAVSHLLKVTPKCRMEMKYELLFSVIYPTFIVSKHRYIIKREESAYFLTVSCLNIFASLLNTVSFAEQFIQKGGLSYVLELVSLPEFSNQCCAILEIAIIVEIYKLMKENAELTYFREISSLASVQMLFKCLSEVTERCYNMYKLQLPADKFEELCDLTKEKEILDMNTELEERFSTTNNTLVSNDKAEESSEDYIEALKTIGTFWKSCAGLCLLCPLFREHVSRAPLLAHSYALLKLALHRLCQPAPAAAPSAAPAETRLLVALMEALLTVQFAVSDPTKGRSRTASCGVVRSALRAATAATAATANTTPAMCSGAGLSALCDALIGVAVARPSRRLAMPRLAPAKVPPLQCESSGSSVEGSSGEEAGPLGSSHASPYASELSDPHPLDDDGYEADVEAGKLAAARGAPPDLAHTMSVLGGLSEYQSPMEALCGGHAAPGPGLAHPELCLVVVDILSQLLQRVVEEESNNGTQESLERVCGGLARALAARLAGGGAPAGLLRRLLTPPAAALLRRTDPRLAELQHSILELIHVVASQSVEPRELAALLQLAAADRPPLAALLSALQRLLAHADPCTPDFALQFPIQLSPHSSDEPTTSLGAGAARCVVDGANWGPWLQGFALVLWLQPLPEAKNEDYDEVDRAVPMRQETGEVCGVPAAAAVHVLSLGQDSLTFELWLNVATGN